MEVPEVLPTPEQTQAGIAVFQQFGEILTIDNLADGDVTRWADVEALPVYVVVQKKAIAAHQELFNRKLQKILNKPTT